MSNWKADFKAHLIDVLVEHGGKVRENADVYGWQEYDLHDKYRSRIRNHGINYQETTYKESNWYEFIDTFDDSDGRVYGVDMDLVLNNGEVLKWRYAGTVSDLIQALIFES